MLRAKADGGAKGENNAVAVMAFAKIVLRSTDASAEISMFRDAVDVLVGAKAKADTPPFTATRNVIKRRDSMVLLR